jgi:predicted esterase
MTFGLALAIASLAWGGRWGVAYPPADSNGTKPAIVFLHGMWAGPEQACPDFVRAATPFGFLVCPRGNSPNGDGWMWTGTAVDAARSIRTALDAVGELAPGRIDRTHDGTLIGYSNGAYFAAEVAMAEPGRWSGVVLLSMKLDLDPARLARAGVKRIVLAAAERDGAHQSMVDAAMRLAQAGLMARFQSLGPGGHELPRDVDARMCEALAWVRGEPQASCDK